MKDVRVVLMKVIRKYFPIHKTCWKRAKLKLAESLPNQADYADEVYASKPVQDKAQIMKRINAGKKKKQQQSG